MRAGCSVMIASGECGTQEDFTLDNDVTGNCYWTSSKCHMSIELSEPPIAIRSTTCFDQASIHTFRSHLSADPGVQFGMQPLHLRSDTLELRKDVARDLSAGDVGHAPEPLEPQLPVEHAGLFQPDPDVLTAEALGLRHNVLDGDLVPPADGGRKLPRHRITHVREPSVPALDDCTGGRRIEV